MKKQLVWAIAILIVALLVVGQMTNFSFETIDIQLHDTYYVLPAYLGVIFFFLIFAGFVGTIMLAERMIRKNRGFAKFVLVANGFIIMFWAFLILQSVLSVYQLYQWHPHLANGSYLGIITLMVGILILLLLLETKAIRELKTKG